MRKINKCKHFTVLGYKHPDLRIYSDWLPVYRVCHVRFNKTAMETCKEGKPRFYENEDKAEDFFTHWCKGSFDVDSNLYQVYLQRLCVTRSSHFCEFVDVAVATSDLINLFEFPNQF